MPGEEHPLASSFRLLHCCPVPDTEADILRLLLAAGSKSVTAATLGRRLGAPRAVLQTSLKKLLHDGLVVKDAPDAGYRAGPPTAGLHPALILAHLRGRLRPAQLVCLSSVDSTNSEAGRQLAAGAPVPLVILARTQTLGRGRRGRAWHSPAGGNLYVTLVFRPQLAPDRLQDFTLWMGLNVCDLVANFCQLRPGLKWPNDLLVGGRKAGGMLTEARIEADHICDLVFGLGLNVNGRTAALPRELQRTAVSLAEAAGAPLDLNRFTAALLGRLLSAYAAFIDGGHRDQFADLWARYDVLRGQPVTVLQGTRRVTGTVKGIDDEGSLIVRPDHGRTERFRAGEVTLGRNAV